MPITTLAYRLDRPHLAVGHPDGASASTTWNAARGCNVWRSACPPPYRVSSQGRTAGGGHGRTRFACSTWRRGQPLPNLLPPAPAPGAHYRMLAPRRPPAGGGRCGRQDSHLGFPDRRSHVLSPWIAMAMPWPRWRSTPPATCWSVEVPVVVRAVCDVATGRVLLAPPERLRPPLQSRRPLARLELGWRHQGSRVAAEGGPRADGAAPPSRGWCGSHCRVSYCTRTVARSLPRLRTHWPSLMS